MITHNVEKDKDIMNLKAMREERKISLEELAEAVHVKPRTVRAWEYGEREPDIPHLIALANHLHCTVDKLIGRNEHDTQ